MLQSGFVREMRLKMLNSLNEISLKFFVKFDVGRKLNTMTGEVEKVITAYKFCLQSIEQFILVIVYMGFTFSIDFKFAILVITEGGLTNLLYKIIYKYVKISSRALTKYTNYFKDQVIQYLNNYKYLKYKGPINKFGNKLKLCIE
jgi:ABC-type transport system involved in cytochrome bd biosynthesis fused ATPase/permease subunit